MLPTVRSTRALKHEVYAACAVCHRSKQLDLKKLEAAGHGDVPLVELKLRCECGSRRTSITVTGGWHGYD